MKITTSIICGITILTQIILNMGDMSHRGDCQAQIVPQADSPIEYTSHSCGCSHHHQEFHSQASTDSCDAGNQEPTVPAPCHCQSEPTPKYIVGDYAIDHRKELESIQPSIDFNFTFCEYSVDLYKSDHPSNVPPPIYEPFVAHNSGDFVTIHLGVFLL